MTIIDDAPPGLTGKEYTDYMNAKLAAQKKASPPVAAPPQPTQNSGYSRYIAGMGQPVMLHRPKQPAPTPNVGSRLFGLVEKGANYIASGIDAGIKEASKQPAVKSAVKAAKVGKKIAETGGKLVNIGGYRYVKGSAEAAQAAANIVGAQKKMIKKTGGSWAQGGGNALASTLPTPLGGGAFSGKYKSSGNPSTSTGKGQFSGRYVSAGVPNTLPSLFSGQKSTVKITVKKKSKKVVKK